MGGSVRKSTAYEKIVHGVKVRRLPIGAYLSAFESVRELPQNLLGKLFPDKSVDEAYMLLKHMRIDTLLKIIGRGAAALPDELLGFFGTQLDISPEKIRNEMTPSELADILNEFWRINDLSNFFGRVRGAVNALK